jgi:hypothetical protein
MYHQKYEYNKPTLYTRPETFEKFLELNSIMVKDITIEEYEELSFKAEQINAEFKTAVKEFEKKQSELKLSSYCYWGLLGHQNAGHIYEYTPKK